MTSEQIDEMFKRAMKLCRQIQALVNDDETPEMAVVMCMRMLKMGYAPQIKEWDHLTEMVDGMDLSPKYAKKEQHS